MYGLGQVHDLAVFITVVVLPLFNVQSDTVQLSDVVVLQVFTGVTGGFGVKVSAE
jgi:hypothetical protein